MPLLIFLNLFFVQDQPQPDKIIVSEHVERLVSSFSVRPEVQEQLRSGLYDIASAQRVYDSEFRTQPNEEYKDILVAIDHYAQMFAATLIQASLFKDYDMDVEAMIVSQMALKVMIDAYLTIAKTTGNRKDLNAKNRHLIGQCFMGSLTLGCAQIFIDSPALFQSVTEALTLVFGINLFLNTKTRSVPRLNLVWPSYRRKILRADAKNLIKDFWWSVETHLKNHHSDLGLKLDHKNPNFVSLSENWAFEKLKQTAQLPLEKVAVQTCAVLLQ